MSLPLAPPFLDLSATRAPEVLHVICPFQPLTVVVPIPPSSPCLLDGQASRALHVSLAVFLAGYQWTQGLVSMG
ncbi:hypothetical protein B0O80DRAFT_278446 [Mortierella sp. GBAus27b]|nr:hypothetical protein B0O80DRAFT_278446 [Mortierella sp. GBAus27b]